MLMNFAMAENNINRLAQHSAICYLTDVFETDVVFENLLV